MTFTIVFDLDELIISTQLGKSLESELQRAKALLGEQCMEQLTLVAMGCTYLVYPGFYEVFRWLHHQRHAIYFFSSGLEKRNMELVSSLMNRSFGNASDMIMENMKIFSRHHCLDLRNIDDDDQYHPFSLFGNYKKVLRNVVVPDEKLPYTLLIEDDPTYMMKGEEENMILLPSCFAYVPVNQNDKSTFLSLHKSYLLCGILDCIFSNTLTNGITLTKSSVQVHTNSENGKITLEALREIRNNAAYYERGLSILRSFNPALQFFGKMK
jgi:hypothetical protein